MTIPIEKLRRDSAVLLEESNRVGVKLLLTDVETSLTFASLALDTTNSPQKRERNRKNARRGYDAVVYFSRKLKPSQTQRRELSSLLRKLRSRLKQAGEIF